MYLYHFTSPERLALIKAHGYLQVTESNIGSPDPRCQPHGEHLGPDVVWLTDDPDATGDDLALTSTLDGTDKTCVRITVDVPDHDVWWWPDFASHHGMNRNWRAAIEKGHDPEAWWVVDRPILVHEFVETHAKAAVAHAFSAPPAAA